MTEPRGVRPTPHQRLHRRIQVDVLTEHGWTLKRIAEHLGVCQATVHNDRAYIKRAKALRRLDPLPWYRLGEIRVDISPTPYVRDLIAEARRVEVWEEMNWPIEHKPSKLEVVDLRDHLKSKGFGPDKIGRFFDSWKIKPPWAKKWGVSSVHRMNREYAERLDCVESLCRRMSAKGMWWGRMARVLNRLGVFTPRQKKSKWKPDNVKKFCVHRGIQLRADAICRFYRMQHHRGEVDCALGRDNLRRRRQDDQGQSKANDVRIQADS